MKPKISLVFMHREKGVGTWPRLDFDYDKRREELTQEIRKSCPDVDFVPFVVTNIEEAEKVIERADEFDGFLIYLIGLSWNAPAIVKIGKPTVLVKDLYGGAGEFLFTLSWAKQRGLPVIGIPPSDIAYALKLFKVIKRLKESKVIIITPMDSPEKYLKELSSQLGRKDAEHYKELFGTDRYGSSGESFDIQKQIERIKKIFGVEVIRMSYEELNGYYDSVSERDAESLANELIGEADGVVEPTRDEIVKSARMHLGMKKALEEKGADAITIDCYRQWHRMRAYPCIGFFKLANEGLTAVCQADLSSTITHLLLRYLTEEMTGEPRPGFTNDPVIDIYANRMIYAHCTASNRVFGPKGPKNPYVIRSHAESRKGVAVQSIMPTGEDITAAQTHFMRDPPLIVMHTGRAVANEGMEDGCRTKLVAEVNTKKIVENWNKDGGWIYPAHWHRVVVYGNWRRALIDLATLMGMKAVEEDE